MFDSDQRIAHLTEMQINDLMNKYYGNAKPQDLIKEYSINIAASKLYTVFPPERCEDDTCEYCKQAMYQKRQSKTDFKSRSSWSKPKKFCIQCGHTIDPHCNCENCCEKRRKELELFIRAREEILEEKKRMINQNFSYDNIPKKTVKELSTREKIFLGALCRLALSEDMTRIEPLRIKEFRLAPTQNYSERILDDLHEKSVILVDVNSDISAFSNDAKSFNKFVID